MEWKIKRGFRQDTLLNSAHKKAAIICRKNAAYLITDFMGQINYRFEQAAPLSIRFTGADDGSAKIRLAETSSPFIPPRAEYMEITSSGTIFSMYQTPRRDFMVSMRDEKIGRITDILRNRARLEFSDGFSADTAAFFYVLALFMLHADDVDIV